MLVTKHFLIRHFRSIKTTLFRNTKPMALTIVVRLKVFGFVETCKVIPLVLDTLAGLDYSPAYT